MSAPPTVSQASVMPIVEVHSFGLTDPGKVRRRNEDQFLIAELVRTLRVAQTSLPQPEVQVGVNRGYIFLVADGMGGHPAGDIASAISVTAVESYVLHVLKRFSNLSDADEAGVLKDFQEAILGANARIAEEVTHHPGYSGMGSTLTMAFTSGWRMFVVHAGDSRCYLFRAGTLERLTEDHTVAGELARRGLIEPEEASRHPFRHTVTNILGGNLPGVRADIRRKEIQPDDVLLICSDGLSDMLADHEIATILTSTNTPQKACTKLIASANAAGGRDNITAIVARFTAYLQPPLQV